MYYVLVDFDGSPRDEFPTRRALREALLDIEHDRPGIAAEFYVLTYDTDGTVIGDAERGDEVLATPTLARMFNAPGAEPPHTIGNVLVAVVTPRPEQVNENDYRVKATA